MFSKDLHQLATLRSGMRRYLSWAEDVARERGLTPAQVQLTLAIRTHPDPAGPTLSELADMLFLRHHSAVGLVDRATDAGLVERERDTERASVVRVRLTDRGCDVIEELGALHIEWLRTNGTELSEAIGAFAEAPVA